MIILYEIAMILFFLVMLPKLLFQYLFQKKYRNSFLQRFGKDFPTFDKGSRALIWIHAVSVGETKAVAALAKKIKNNGSNPIILITTATETGHAEAKRSMPFADYHAFLPLDFYGVMNPILKRLKPDLVILTEGDYWYHFLRLAKRYGAKTLVVNGKLSQKSFQRFSYVRFFARKLFSQVDAYCVQNEDYKHRFEGIGVSQNKLTITGNMKFDEVYPKLSHQEMSQWKRELGISETDPVLIVGSTHHPEEKIVLDALTIVWKQFPHLKTLIVPRHPERYNEVINLLTKQQVTFKRYSQNMSDPAQVILVDAMGILRKCYQLGTIAIVAGSFTDKVGGHNVIEPCWYGVPVLFGPHMETQKELAGLVKQYQSGLQVDEKALATTILDLLKHEEKRKSFGAGGNRMVAEMQGALERTWEVTQKYL